MTNSILDNVKKVLGIDAEYAAFDEDIMMHINTVFDDLNQIGVGPQEGFQITDKNAVWADFIGPTPLQNRIKTYTYLRVRLLFDPPATSFTIDAMKQQIQELEWRISVHREEAKHPWPEPQIL